MMPDPDIGQEPGAAGEHPRPRRGRAAAKWIAALVLALTAAAGVAGGVLLDRFVLHPTHRPFGHFPPGHGGPRGHGPDRFRDEFARELGLTPDQQVKVDSLMSR